VSGCQSKKYSGDTIILPTAVGSNHNVYTVLWFVEIEPWLSYGNGGRELGIGQMIGAMSRERDHIKKSTTGNVQSLIAILKSDWQTLRTILLALLDQTTSRATSIARLPAAIMLSATLTASCRRRDKSERPMTTKQPT